MQCRNQVLLRFHANIENYELAVYNGCEVCRKRVFSRQGCLCLSNPSPCIRIVATPLQDGYSTKVYYWLDTTRCSIHNLYFSFPRDAASPSAAVNAFTLTDANYGLPIDGALLFTSP